MGKGEKISFDRKSRRLTYIGVLLINCLIAQTVFAADSRDLNRDLKAKKEIELCLETTATLSKALDYINDVSKNSRIGEISKDIKTLSEFHTALTNDIRASSEGKFSVLSSYTLEQIGKFGLKRLPDIVEGLKKIGKLPSGFELPATFGVDELAVGISRHVGSGTADIETITSYLDGFNQACWAVVGFLVGGPQAAGTYQSIANTTTKLLREATRSTFNSLVLAARGQAEEVVRQWRELQEVRLSRGLSAQTITEVYGEELLIKNGLSRKRIQQLDIIAQDLNQHVIGMKRDLSVEKIEDFKRSGKMELGGIYIDPELICVGTGGKNVRTEVLRSRPSGDDLHWTVKVAEGKDCLLGQDQKSEDEPAYYYDARMRAISLRVLERQLAVRQNDKSACPRALLDLGGISRINGYVIDDANRDVILIGKVIDSLPSLRLDDFVVAIRNAWLKYAELRGHTYYYSHPGCSIDPSSEVMEKLEKIGRQILTGSYPGGMDEGIEKWHQVGSSPQTVRVLGVPFNSHFARLMVEADYHMKSLVDGSEQLDIPGFNSLIDLSLEQAKSDIFQGREISIPRSSINRFWFYPGENQYVVDEGVLVIKRLQVTLLSEEEFISRTGKIMGKGRPDPLAQKFADMFTAGYEKVAARRPVYCELENLFRFVAIAKALKFKGAFLDAGLDLKYLRDSHQISTFPVESRLPGRTNVKQFRHCQDFGSYSCTTELWLPTCGGVSMDLEVNRENFEKDTTGELSKLRSIVIGGRPPSGPPFWSFPPPSGSHEALSSSDENTTRVEK